jgi:hypothetical protein
MKSKLKIEELAVESFVVSAAGADARGTVAAHAKPPTREFTCLPDDCQPSFAYSCPYDVCPQ